MESSVVLCPSTDIKGNFKLSRGEYSNFVLWRETMRATRYLFDQFLDLEDSVSGDDKYCFKRLDFLNKNLSKWNNLTLKIEFQQLCFRAAIGQQILSLCLTWFSICPVSVSGPYFLIYLLIQIVEIFLIKLSMLRILCSHLNNDSIF